MRILSGVQKTTGENEIFDQNIRLSLRSYQAALAVDGIVVGTIRLPYIQSEIQRKYK